MADLPTGMTDELLEVINLLIGEKQGDVYWGPTEGSMMSDALYYRQGEAPEDTTDPDEQEDFKIANEYLEAGQRLAVMRGQSILKTADAGCDRCGTNDRETGSKFCVACKG